MKKKIGSKLASSVRQAKSNRPQKNAPDTDVSQDFSETTTETAAQAETPPSFIPSQRVWPD
ncbi:MAG TPA: hypothetical protein ENJ13_05805 [Chromatiales bacterium]|nr:hypothetical protein [Chromatiales bacterium]